MSRGTRNAALSLNTSYTAFSEEPVETALGTRYRVYGHTATGGRKELAMVKSALAAHRIADYLRSASVSLRFAAEAIANDREADA